MIIRISAFLRGESGKAESKAPATIMILLILVAAYWGWKYGWPKAQDYMFVKDCEKLCRYDVFKTKFRPPNEERRAVFMNCAQEYGIEIPERSDQEYLRVGDVPGTKWYKVDVRYKKIVKHPVGKPKVLWFQHTIYPPKH
ncbi:hypothetical protein ACFL27_09705 [candidate division CSSED10-310 bacterium]|uniref:DUF4258 domain-containing protein n=1 Tax=candidate division CSSED10-310 bacterium TaxID=2855610 RepID=A0ABV6YW59_UNCC1